MNATPKHDGRWSTAWLLGLTTFLAYLDRVNISHALILIGPDLHLRPTQEGIVLGAFSVGYVALMGTGGTLVDVYGPFLAMQIAIVVWSIATGATILAIGLVSLVFVRVAVGAGEAPIFPASAAAVMASFPASERGRATAIFDGGSYVGAALSAPVVVYLMLRWGWRLPFLVCACMGFALLFVWRQHTTRWSIEKRRRSDLWHPRTFKIAMTRPVMLAAVGFFCYNYGKSFFLTWLPLYFVRDRSFSVSSVGFAGALPPMAALFGEALGGWSVDALFKRSGSIAISRTLPICIGLATGAAVALAPFIRSNAILIGLLCFAFAGITSASPGIWTIPAHTAPSADFVGTVGGVQNTISNLAGFVAPIITGWVLATTGHFSLALIITGAICISGAVAYSTVFMPMGAVRESQL